MRLVAKHSWPQHVTQQAEISISQSEGKHNWQASERANKGYAIRGIVTFDGQQEVTNETIIIYVNQEGTLDHTELIF